MRRAALALLLLLTGMSITGQANAQGDSPPDSGAEARQRYQMGTQAFASKRYSEAALHFEAAAAFKANAVALYTAALAWDLASRPERAADAYSRALDVPGLDAKQTTIAKDRVAALERTLGTVAVTGPDGWKVQLDTLTEVVVPAKLHAAHGVHALSIRAPNKSIERRDVSLEAGKVVNVDLKDEPKVVAKVEPTEPPKKDGTPPPPPPPDPTPPRLREPFWNTIRVVGVGIAGVGVAALGGAAVLGVSANGAKEAYDAAPSRPGYDHAASLETWTNVALISGAVLVAGGIALVVIPIGGSSSEGSVRVGATPGGMVVGGSF